MFVLVFIKKEKKKKRKKILPNGGNQEVLNRGNTIPKKYKS